MGSRDDGEGGRGNGRESRHRPKARELGSSHRRDVGHSSHHTPHNEKKSRHHQRHVEQELDLLQRLQPEEPKTGFVLGWLKEAREIAEKPSLTAQNVVAAPETDSRRDDKHGRHNDLHPRDTRRETRVRRDASTDSSLLRPAQHSSPERRRQEPLDMTENNGKTAPRNEKPKQKRRRTPSPSIREASSESDLPKPEEIFEKRKRHKTKEDRYEVKEKKRKTDDEKEVKKRSKPFKRSDAAKATRAAGEDLVRSFKSDKIAQDRLTMRPGTGIFRNGRAASPTRKRGISDLAFSEMQFLKSSKHRAPAFEKEVVISKHGQKKKNERERERNDISNYFAPRQPAVPQERSHKERQRPLALSERDRNMAPSSDVYGERIGRPRSNHQYERDRREQYLGFGTGLSSPRKFSLPPPPSEPIYTKQIFEDTARSSSPHAPAVTWSVTERSMSRHGRQEDVRDVRRESSSSSPSEVRRKLIESGILDGLGRYEPVFDSDTVGRQELLMGRHHARQSDRSQTRSRLSMRSSSVRLNTTPDLERGGAEASRRSQVEAARRALMLEQEEDEHCDQPHIASKDEPREVLAGRAYIPKKKSAIPRRPATTTPLHPRGQRQPAKRRASLNDISMEEKTIGEDKSPSKFDTQQLGVPDGSYAFYLMNQDPPGEPVGYSAQASTVDEYGYDPSAGQSTFPREPSVHMCPPRFTTTGFPTPSTHYYPQESTQYEEMPMYYAQGQLHYQEDFAVFNDVRVCEAKAEMPGPLAHESVPAGQDFSLFENIPSDEADQIPTGDEYTFANEYLWEFAPESPRQQYGIQALNYSRNQAGIHAPVPRFHGDNYGGLQYPLHQQQPHGQSNYAQQNAASTLHLPTMMDEPLWTATNLKPHEQSNYAQQNAASTFRLPTIMDELLWTPKNQKFFQHSNLAAWEAGQSTVQRSGLTSEQELITLEVQQNFWKGM